MRPEAILSQKPQDYSTIYIDMDSYFASVEQFYHPKLRGKPVGVASGASFGASIIAASYDAKARGVHTGTKVGRALELCPGIQIVEGSPDSYRAVHREFMTILHNTICLVQPKGIDEAYLKVPSYAQSRESVFALVKEIKASLFKKYNEHICCSVGIATNVWLAKLAASSHKPKGFTCLTLVNDIPSFYYGLSLTDLTGVGNRMAKQFSYQGIYTPLDLYMSSWQTLGTHFGINGHKWYLRMRGFEVDMFTIKPQKSLGHQVTMGEYRPSGIKEITTFIIKICETLGKRLRYKTLRAQAIHISLYFEDQISWHNKIEKLHAFDDNESIISYSIMLLKKLNNNSAVKKISLTLYCLTDVWQLQFESIAYQNSDDKVSKAFDKVETQFSSPIASRGSTLFEQSYSLNRVGFAGDLLRETEQN
ncbi:hypothetical protein H0W80_03295 [Candidatus Saccharibacteria bacterium]|nr:hypothetical protein [Candidatus Saccharibacteria bacterium]